MFERKNKLIGSFDLKAQKGRDETKQHHQKHNINPIYLSLKTVLYD